MSRRKSSVTIEDQIHASNQRIIDKTQPLDYVLASDLPESFNPPDEILEGLLTAGDGSVIYGDSNSGKTFLAVSMAASIAQGTQWLGRRTERGLVLYLAAESPASIRRRLQAYQRYHKVKLQNFVIVQNPIDLFSDDGDTRRIIGLVKQLESQTGQKVRLIVGDTLARLSSGANENAGQDMSVVIRHFDIIRTETCAHFTLIHHSGKNAANGARGWSGVRAAVDTEMEVTDSIDGRCIEVTKQRDLDGKGDRIGFRLELVILGDSKWGTPTGSCVVLPWETPPKKRKLLRGVAAAVEEYMYSLPGQGVDKKVCEKHFSGRHHRTSISRVLHNFVEEGRCTVFNDFYTKVAGEW